MAATSEGESLSSHVVDKVTQDDSRKDQPRRDALRKQLRSARRALSPHQLSLAADSLTPRVLDVIDTLGEKQRLQHVAGYLAFQGEINVAPVMAALRRKNIMTYVPRLDGETLRFAEWSDNTPYTTNRYGIVEPDVDDAYLVRASAIDAVLVPLVAFDAKRQRMGMGGGYYDKTFAARAHQPGPPWLIGVAHQLQQVETVYPAWWDVALDYVVTDKSVLPSQQRLRV